MSARILEYSGCEINIRELTNFSGSVLHNDNLSCSDSINRCFRPNPLLVLNSMYMGYAYSV